MDCAFEHGKNCAALTKKCCEGCRFRKTKEEVEKCRKKAQKRIASLPEDEQTYIKLKYYTWGKL